MDIKSTEQTSNSAPEDYKEHSFGLSKADPELYNEEDDVAMPVVRVKHVNLPNKGDRWKIMNDNAVVFVLEGAKLSKKERTFLRTLNGVSFLLGQAKEGIKSFNGLRAALKKVLKPIVNQKTAPKKKARK